MEQCLGTLTGFPPPGQTLDPQTYDALARDHVKAARTLAKEMAPVLCQHTTELFTKLDLRNHTLSYFALFEALHAHREHEPATLAEIRVRLLELLQSFDTIQARYMGSALVGFLELVLSGNAYPAAVAVKAAGDVLLRLDPEGIMFTSLHPSLARLAYRSGSLPQVRQIIDKHILLFPHMAGQPPQALICDPSLRNVDLYTMAGFTRPISPLNLLEYNLFAGMCHTVLGNWSSALTAFERCVSHPVRDKAVSKLMMDGYKRWMMITLILHGDRARLPPYTEKDFSVVSVISCKPYHAVADIFVAGDAVRLRNELEAGLATWSSDNVEPMMAAVRDAFQKWQIVRLNKMYEYISIPDVRGLTQSARTGVQLESDDEVVALVRQVIDLGLCRAELVTSPHEPAGRLPWLHFVPERDAMTEEVFADTLRRITASSRFLQDIYRQFDERVSSSPDYVRHLAKERFRAETPAGGAGGVGGIGGAAVVSDNDAIMEDEDLMAA